MKKILGIAFAVALVAIVLNDGGRYLSAWNGIDVIAQQSAVAAAATQSRVRDEAANAAVAAAQPQGATVYMYDQDDATVHVWIEMPVRGTWVLAPAAAMFMEQPANVPLIVRTDKTATWR